MRVVYDATPLLMRSAGVKNYHYALLRRLIPLLEGRSLELFPFLPGLTANHNERSNYSFPGTVARLGAVLASNYLRLPLPALASRGADLFHATHHVWRYPTGIAVTSMVHDPTPLTMPECHTESNVRYFRVFLERLAPQLRRILAPSEAVKADLVKYCGLEARRITAIHHGVDEDFFSGPEGIGLARREYSLPKSYILSVGSLEPRKNLITLAAAYALLPPSLRAAYPLVVVGASGWKNSPIRNLLRRSRNVRLLGYVQRGRLPGLYAGASAFVFPSLYEGFGLPLLEAMAAGAPVVSSNASAMPEVVGDCGRLVDPRDPTALAEALQATLEDRKAAGELARRGRERARSFTWERCARETLAFFEAAII